MSFRGFSTDLDNVDQQDNSKRVTGFENYEEVMASLGLTDLKPVPRVVEFEGDDPLGAQAIAQTSCLVSTTSKIKVRRRGINSVILTGQPIQLLGWCP